MRGAENRIYLPHFSEGMARRIVTKGHGNFTDLKIERNFRNCGAPSMREPFPCASWRLRRTMAVPRVQQWAKARYGVRLIVLVVQQTFGGLLNFVPHLHVLVSAGGLMEAKNRWIHRLKYDQRELMCAWRYAVVAFLSEALKRKVAPL